MTVAGIIATALGVAFTAVFGYLGVRFTGRSAARATSLLSHEEWNAAYRSAAERHMGWDFDMKARLERAERKLGIDDDPIPDPPPLFPSPKG